MSGDALSQKNIIQKNNPYHIKAKWEHGQNEEKIYHKWEKINAFKTKGKGQTFTIAMPPPNVTGSLHMGHALNNTIQDIIIRFKRMNGYDVLWQAGTDHAGIATQMVVERLLENEQKISRKQIGRKKFVEKIWQWKEKSGGIITKQLRRLGASCDWSKERFTMDQGLSQAVIKVFVQLYNQGLIYKDKRLVNWDPKFQSAISDLEVVQKDIKGTLWYFKYPIENENQSITIATTRPETILGDTAVIVHPDDTRHQKYIGKNVILPLVGRKIPVIADEYADPEQGTGAVKMTPAHDFNDFEIGKKHDLPMISVMDETASLKLKENEDFLRNVPDSEELQKTLLLDKKNREEARKNIIQRFKDLDLYVKEEPHIHAVPHGDRSGTVIEPRLTEQWFVNAKILAKQAIEAVENGETKFIPQNWTKTYYEWMKNIQPWCISRQLWWGHQIPAWYGPDNTIFVETSEQEAHKKAHDFYGQKTKLKRDPDVLDTWFSSALWPFSTLGWPEKTPELKRHYPTDLLVSGFDIIFFWIARMMMMGLHFTKDENQKPTPPFHHVYIHALVRDEKGRKMSKSLGNVIDPLEIIDHYGADALRFTLAIMAAQGRDVKLSKERIEGYRNFATKLWNATRFALLNQCIYNPQFKPQNASLTVNQWIINETVRAIEQTDRALETYKFNEAAETLYRFIRRQFCDWYIEAIKPMLAHETPENHTQCAEIQHTTGWVINHILRLLHPFMPFITEELWQITEKNHNQTMLIHAQWPQINQYNTYLKPNADEEVNRIINLVSAIRSVRTELNITPKTKLNAFMQTTDCDVIKRIEKWKPIIRNLAGLKNIVSKEALPENAARLLVNNILLSIPLEGFVDLDAEKKRLKRERDGIIEEISQLQKKLNNKNFAQKAPKNIIEKQKQRIENAQDKKEKIEKSLQMFST